MKKKVNPGFSLIELLVVIAIVGVLAAIAIPQYKNYVVRSQITSALIKLKAMSDSAAQVYARTGAFPATITWNGQTLSSANFSNAYFQTVVNDGSIIAANYGIVASDGNGILFQVNVAKLNGITGYVDPSTAGNNYTTDYSSIRYGIRVVNGTLMTGCGYWNGVDSAGIPLQYLPSKCQCLNVSGFAAAGTGPCV